MIPFDWIGNVFIVIGLYYIGNKKRWAFLFSMVGEAAWIVFALQGELYSLAIICVVFFLMALRGYIKWGVVDE